jgi:hypothetical protein
MRDVYDGNPGAVLVVRELARLFPDTWADMLTFLALRGPRGTDLWLQYSGPCSGDVYALGRDLVTRMMERRESAG